MKNVVNRAPNEGAKKNKFQSKTYPQGTRTIWRYLSALFILFTFAIGNVWAANTPASAGTYSLVGKKPGGENKFYKLGDGVYIHRKTNSSWDSSMGMKIPSTNDNGVAVYLSSSMKVSALINKKSDKNAVSVELKAYPITNGSSTFDALEAGTDNNTTVSVTIGSTASYTLSTSFAALSSKAAENKSTNEVTFAAGYYYIVGTDDKGTTYLTSVTLASAAAASAAPNITAQPATAAANYEKDAAATALSVTATGNGTLTYQWYKNTTASNESGTAIDGATSASYTPSTAAYGTLYYYCVVTNTESGKSGTIAKSNVSGAITVPYPATGAATVTYEVKVGTSQTTLDTNMKEANSSSISNFVGFTTAGGLEVQSGGGKTASSPKIATPTAKDDAKYVYVTFDVASGHIFTINSVTTKMVAVSNPCDIEVELSDATTSEALSYNQTNNSDPGADHEFEFAGKAYEGTVTLKIYAYGASASSYRIGKPLTISGTVAVKPSPAAPTISAPTADQAAVYDLNDVIAPLEITASGYPTPTYQWYKNSSASTEGATAISGAESASYTPANDEASDDYYYCVASNSQGSATSHYFHVTVNAPAVPTIYTETTALTLTSNKIATASETFTFSGANLGETAVTLVLASAVDGLTLSESSVTPTAGAIADTEVTVSYKSVVDVTEASVNLYLKQGDDILKTIVLTYSSTAGIESLTSISAATTWDWNGAADAAYGTLGQNDMIVLANADVTWDAGFNALAIAGKLQHYYRDSKYAQGHELKFNTTIPGRVTVTFSNTGGKDIARAPRITDVNGSYAPTDEADGSKNTTAKTYTHNVAAGDVLIAGFEMQTGTPANMLRFYEVKFVPTYSVVYAANGGSGDMTDANAYVAGDEVTLLANTFTPATGFVWSGWAVTKTASGDPIEVSEGKFTMPAEAVTVTAQWEDVSKVAVIVETNVKYETLAAAIATAEAGQTVQLIQDITQEEAILIDKNLTLDLNNKTFTVTNPSSEYSNRAIKVTAGTIVIKNGTVDALSNETHNGGCWGSLRQEGGHLTCNNVTFKNYRSGGLGLKPVGGTLILNECTVLSEIGGGLELGNATVEVNNCTFTQTGTDAQKIYGACFGMGKMGTLTINGGTYTSENYSFYIYTSGGTINVNSGTFAGDIKTEMNNTQYPSAVGTINISGGTFDGVGENPIVLTTVTANDHIAISGGVFDAPIEKQYCAEGYVPQDNGDGTYGVTPKDGVSIIKATINSTTKNTIGEVTGLYKKDASCGGLSSYKFNGKGAYIGIELVAGQTFNEGDIINIHTTSAAGQGTIALYNDHGNTVSSFHDYGVMGGTGDNKFALPASAEDKSIIYVCRTEANTWNGYVDYIEVTRAMNPILTAIQFNDTKVDVTGTNVEVTLPNGTNLAAMTITPTIVWNGAGTAAAANAWEWDVANTYTVTDKDGDATVYTITLTEAVPAVDPTLTYDDGAYIVGLSALDMSTLKTASNSDGEITYTLKDAGTTGATIDGNNFTATAAGTATITASQAATVAYNAITVDFNVVVTEPAEVDGIKMVEAGALTGNFVSARTLSSGNNTVEGIAYTKYITMSSTMSSFGNEVAPSATKGIYYYPSHKNIRFYFYVYNNQSSAKKIYIYTVDEDAEGTSDATSANVSVDPGRHLVYADVELTKHAAVVFGVENTGTQICQIVAVESGDELLQGGEAGYIIDYNKCYISPKAGTVAVYDGIEYKLLADAKLVSATNVQLQTLGTDYIKFHLDAPMTVNVFADNKKYYVGSECSTDEAAMLYEATGDGEFTLAAGNWYINGSGAQVKINKLSFMLPKCEEPTIETQPATKQTFGPGNLTATVVATVSDGGTLKYQWYNASNDEEVDGATSATLTTTTEGTYYVIVTNTLADHSDNFIKSAEATLGYRVTDDATLSALSASEGTLDPTFDKDVEEYRVDLPEGTVDVPTLSATATMDGYANVAINNATAFVNYEATSTVVVTAEDGLTQKTYTVKFYVDHLLPQVDVTESTTWDWTYAAEGTVTIKVTDSTEPIKKNEEGLMANVRVDDNKPTNDATFNSQALLFYGENVRAKDGGRWYASLGHIKFNVTKPGIVEVEFSDNGSNNRCLSINGFMSPASSSKTDVKTFKVFVPAGEVTLMGMEGAAPDKYIRISKITYTVKESPDYTRNVTNNIGTLCVNHNVLVGGAQGATFYQIASRNELYDFKIDFEEVLPGEELKAGEPYIFQSTTGRIDLYYGATVADAPVAVRGMIGSFANTTLDITEENKSDILYIAQNKLWNCEDLVASDLEVVANRAYIDMSQVPTYAEYTSAPQQNNPAPRRRVTLGRNSENTATGIDAINATDKPMKLIIDGNIFIIRGEKMYDVTGKLVK